MRSLARAIFAGILVASALNNPADASGRTPALPLPEEKFESHAACVVHLETLYAQDKATGQPHPVASGSMETRQRMVRSNGVQRVDAQTAQYAVHVGHEIRVRLPDIKAIRTSYSYEERTLNCVAERLTGTRLTGYYQEGYAPMEGAAKPDTQ